MGNGPPRTNKYTRILARLFEFLAVFHILKRANGPHTAISQLPADLQTVRRRFITSLCYLCDYRKGGKTTTSIGLESRDDGVVFWVAANLSPNDDVLTFISVILENLRGEPNSTVTDRETLTAMITLRSIQFVAPRLRKERRMLARAARSCETYLAANIDAIMTPGARALIEWLPQFYSVTTDPLIFCQAAYNGRHAPQMKTLEALKEELKVAPLGTVEPFRSVKHLVGRLAEKIRVPANLVNDSLLLGPLLQSYTVRRVEAPMAARVPASDGLRNLDSIVRRMLRADDPRLKDMQSYLGQLDGSMKLEDAIRAMYDDEQAQHNVHAEIQILEDFHRNQRIFVEQDRYIACSKLACLCCKFYFKFHPGRFVEPESHQKTYLNWRPIDLPDGGEDSDWPDQRRVLGNLSKELSNLLEEHIVTQQQPTPWQPDSITNITAITEALTLSEVQEEFESGDGESDVFTDSDSLAHLHDDDVVNESDDGSRDGDEQSEGGVVLTD
ncbi:uncharacterized protein FIESC28_01013 [Fusarium coffeatum]|uniref:Uncharacterized protein n=1 Tax=Fusarium coffeatum TaxID=231269 RepID=A0A366SBX4_9HYPO|nr:uncharacterized protein FIESC28_01013 [Fusarium coffeatum]RBR26230.1 hypothetical protein FIESC28_01013 [Fusarium coffeatum]